MEELYIVVTFVFAVATIRDDSPVPLPAALPASESVPSVSEPLAVSRNCLFKLLFLGVLLDRFL